VAGGQHGRLVSILGPAGSGKSTLLAAARAAAERAGLSALEARGRPEESDFAFGVLLQLFEPLVAGLDEDHRRVVFAGPAAPAAALFTADGPSPGDLRGHRLAHALHHLASDLAGRERGTPTHGVAFLVDDLHWADGGSLRTLRHIANRVDEAPILLVLASAAPLRSERDTGSHNWLSHRPARRLRLRWLTVIEVTQLTEAALAADPAEELGTAVHHATAGIPLFVSEVINHLTRAASVASASDVEQLLLTPPRAIVGHLSDRLARCSESAQRFARAGAVLGSGSAASVVCELADLPLEEGLLAADELLAADILGCADPISFICQLTSSAIEAGISPGRRALAHARAARLLALRGALPQALADHLLQAPATHDADTTTLLRRAARESLQAGGPERAARLLTHALETSPAGPMRTTLMLELGSAEIAAGAMSGIDRLYEAMADVGEPAVRVAAALKLAAVLAATGHHRDASETLDRMLAELGETDQGLAHELRLSYAALATLDAALVGRGRARLEQVLAAGGGSSAQGKLVVAHLAMRRAAEAAPGQETHRLARQAWGGGALLREHGPDSASWTLVAGALTIAGFYDEAAAVADAACTAAAAAGPLAVATAHYHQSWPELRRGRLTQAIAASRLSLESQAFGWAAHTGSASAVVALALIARDDLEGAAIALDSVDPLGLEISSETAPMLEARGRLRMEQARFADALQDCLAAGRLYRELRMHTGPSFWRQGAALAAWQMGWAEEADRLSDEQLDLARGVGTPAILGGALRVRGLIQGGPAGLQLLQEAVAALSGSEARLELTEGLVDLGAALRRAGQRAQAREPLREAAAHAQAIGARRLERRAVEELRATGGRARSAGGSDRETLTPGERRVVELARLGHTNREIATALFVTPKAVEWHLANAYRKLGIRSRRQLGPRLAEPA
jgi:DNA-binding CsgD family transcriptional regulator